MSFRENVGNAATVTAVNSGAAGAAGWVDDNYRMLMLAISATSLLIGAILGWMNHLENRKRTEHQLSGE